MLDIIQKKLPNRRWLLGVFVLFCWYVGYWFGAYRIPFQRVHALEAIPFNTAFILESNQPAQTIQNWRSQAYGVPLEGIQFINKWVQDWEFISQLFAQTADYQQIPATARLISGAQWSSQQSFEWLFVLEKYSPVFNLDTFLTQLPKDYSHRKLSFRGKEIYELQANNETRLVIAYHRGLILLAHKATFVELGLEQLDNIRTNVFFSNAFNKTYHQLSRKDDCNIYINYTDIQLLLNTLATNIPEHIKGLSTAFDWSGAVARTETNQIFLQGSTQTKKNRFWTALASQPVRDSSNIGALLPDNTALVTYFGIKDFAIFYKNANTWETQSADFEEFILPFMEGEFMYFMTEPTSTDLSADKFVAVRVQDPKIAQARLKALEQKVGSPKKIQYQNFELRQLNSNSLLAPIFGELLNPLQQPFYILVDDFVLFANSATALELWIEKHNFGKNLQSLPAYQAPLRAMSQSNSLYIFLNTKYLLSVLKNCTHPNTHLFLEEQFSNLQTFCPVGIQFKPHKSRSFTNHISLFYNKNNPQSPQPNPPSVGKDSTTAPKTAEAAYTAWRYDLLKPMIGSPHVVKDIAKNQSFVLVQDADNRLYLFKQSGELVWDKLLDAPVISKIHGLDFYRNGDMQFVFNTKWAIHMLDKAGNEFKKIQFVAPAQTGILLIDYEHGVRMLVGCGNGNVYGYDKQGKPLTGWNPKANLGVLTQDPQMLVTSKRNYILLQTKTKLYISDIDEQQHKTLSCPIENSTQSFRTDPQSERIVLGLADGKIQIVNLEAKTFSLKAEPKLDANPRLVYAQLTGDSRKDYLRYKNGWADLHFYDDKNKYTKIFSRELEGKPADIFEVFTPNGLYSQIGGLSPQQERIYLYDENGDLRKGFPLVGTTRFQVVDFLGDRSEMLLVGNKNTLLAYKIGK